jgi:hypothetical protein
MPRRHSLDLPTTPSANSGRTETPSADLAIAALALLVAAMLGLAGIISGHQPALFGFAAIIVAVPPTTAMLVARRARARRNRPRHPRTKSAWSEIVPDPLTGVPVLADFERELQRVLRRGEPDITVLRLALVPVGGTTESVDLQRRLVLAAVNWQEAVADDRFAVLLHECPIGAATRVIDRLRDATPPGTVCAVGAATWDGEESARALLGRATRALDAAPQLQGGDVLRDPQRVAAGR